MSARLMNLIRCLAENTCFWDVGYHAASQGLAHGFQGAVSLTQPSPAGRGNRCRVGWQMVTHRAAIPRRTFGGTRRI
jgi:hypothetical protein